MRFVPLLASFQVWPRIAKAVTFWPWIIRIKHVLMSSRALCTTRNFGNDRGGVPYSCRVNDTSVKLGT